MTPPDPAITSPILDELLSTPYACSSLSRLSGGTANFVYRGTLQAPLDDPAGMSTVILKHAEEFLAGFKDFKLTADRCVCSFCFSLGNYVHYGGANGG